MNLCLHCSDPLWPVRLECPGCGLGYDGPMRASRLARLSADSAELAEKLILAGGNLTALAGQIGVSHPTVRKRVDGLIAELAALRDADKAEADRMLQDVEAGRLRPEEAARLIGEMNGSL
jgi:hypothetical protein